MKQFLLVVFAFCLVQFQALGQIVVTPTNPGTTAQKAAQMAQYLVGQGVSVSNAIYTGDTLSAALFNGVNTNLGIDSGIILSSGWAATAMGEATLNSSDITSGGTNVFLDALANGFPINNSSMLEFDVKVTSDTLRFEYVFASEEYPEFPCGMYNDVFGFFISGPGVVGNVSGPGIPPGTRNLALIPGTNTPVAINNLHPQHPYDSTCTPVNVQYYVDNASGLTVRYDGFTVVLKAELWGLTPCETYHLRLVIGDGGDPFHDSGVFIKQGSLTSSGVVFQGTTEVSYAGFGDLLEGTAIGGPACVSGGFAIKRYGDLSQPKTVSFAISGTAQNGWDYTDANFLPLDSVYTFAPGQDSMYIEIYPYSDGWSNEPDETIIFDLKSTCTDSATGESAMLIIKDEVPLGINTTPAITGPVCAGVPIQINATGAVDYIWLNSNGLSDDLIPNPILTPTVNAQYVVIGAVLACQTTDTLNIEIEPAPLNPAGPDFSSCDPGTVQLLGSGGGTYSWTGPNNFTSSSATPTVSYTNPGLYTLTVTTPAGCTYTDVAEVETLGPIFNISSNVTALCPGESVQLMSTITGNGTGPITYNYTPAATLTDPSVANPVATPVATTTYVLSVTNGANCTNTDSITITVKPSPNISAGPDQAICEGETVTLSATNSSGAGTTFTWSNANLLSSGTALNPVASPTTTTQFVLTATLNGCESTSDVTVTVKPRPAITAGPDIEICPLQSQILQASLTTTIPGTTFSWTPATGLSATDVLNPMAYPGTTTTYTAIATADGCASAPDFVLVTTKAAPQVDAGPSAILCPNVPSVRLTGSETSGLPGVTFLWKPSTTAATSTESATDVTPSTTTYYILEATANGCTAKDSALVTVGEPMNLSIAPSPTGGQAPVSVQFAANGNNLVAYAWDFGNNLVTTDTSSLPNPMYIYTQAGQYVPTLVATDNLGCIDSASFDNIRVSTGIANIFTPNNDGVNDVFNIGVLPANTSVKVFNRWGKIIFESGNYQNNWDGDDAPDGVYFYNIRYPDSGEEFKGWLEIHR